MKFRILIESEEEDMLHGSNIALWTFILVINKWALHVETVKGEFSNEVS